MALWNPDTPPIYPDGTAAFLEMLVDRTRPDVRCSLGDNDFAMMAFRTPNGCVARPDDKFQALCGQHLLTDGLKADAEPILDLTLNDELSRGLTLPLHVGFSALTLENFLRQE